MIPKFRAWHGELNMMFEVKSLVFTLNLATIASENDLVPSRTCSFDDIILMQSTGLFDVNGNEIFEGDVVELHRFTENYSKTFGFYEGEETLVGAVIYGYTVDDIKYFGKVYPQRWLFENRYRKLDFSVLSGLHEESFKVIGDIYQNPELVEGLK